jgi:hypothetical protein
MLLGIVAVIVQQLLLYRIAIKQPDATEWVSEPKNLR